MSSFAEQEGERLALALAACETEADLEAYVKEVRAHPLLQNRGSTLAMILQAVEYRRAGLYRRSAV